MLEAGASCASGSTTRRRKREQPQQVLCRRVCANWPPSCSNKVHCRRTGPKWKWYGTLGATTRSSLQTMLISAERLGAAQKKPKTKKNNSIVTVVSSVFCSRSTTGAQILPTFDECRLGPRLFVVSPSLPRVSTCHLGSSLEAKPSWGGLPFGPHRRAVPALYVCSI